VGRGGLDDARWGSLLDQRWVGLAARPAVGEFLLDRRWMRLLTGMRWRETVGQLVYTKEMS
jgi:hypothetical protein